MSATFICVEVCDDEGSQEVNFPAKWIICGTCRGNGKHSLRFGAITREDREENWDDESWDDYMAGNYDERCDDCSGSGKRLVIDEEACENNPKFQKHLENWRIGQESLREMEAIYAAERRMGA